MEIVLNICVEFPNLSKVKLDERIFVEANSDSSSKAENKTLRYNLMNL